MDRTDSLRTDLLMKLEAAFDRNDINAANAIADKLGLSRFREEPLYPCMHDNTCMPITNLLCKLDLYW